MSPIDTIVYHLKDLQPVAIAWSGGADSTLLALLCHKFKIDYQCITIIGPHLTFNEIRSVLSFRDNFRLNHQFIFFHYHNYPEITQNNDKRCFHCKNLLFKSIRKIIPQDYSIIDGTNFDDTLDYRPGMEAARINSVTSPLAVNRISKKQVLAFLQGMGFSFSYNTSRSCILCRFAYGLPLEPDLVDQVRRAEDYLLDSGLKGFRIRILPSGKSVLQIDIEQQEFFEPMRTFFLDFAFSIGFNTLQIEYLEFSNITGYYDKNTSGALRFSDN